MNKKKKQYRYKRVCKHCGETFEGKSKNTSYCPKCRVNAKQYSWIEKKAKKQAAQDEAAKEGVWLCMHTPLEVTNDLLRNFLHIYGRTMRERYGHYLRPSWCSKARWHAFAALCTNPEKYAAADPALTHRKNPTHIFY